MASNVESPCRICLADATARCAKCRIMRYCSRQHQEMDWQRHKRECATLGQGIGRQVGFPLRVKAWFLPVQGGQPRLIDVPYKLEHNLELPHMPTHHVDFSALLDEGHQAWPTTIQINGFRTGEPIGRSLTVVRNDTPKSTTPVNQCIEAITGSQGHKWEDNVIVLRCTSPDQIAQYEDVQEEDLGVFRKYLEEGGNGANALTPENQANMLRAAAMHDGAVIMI
ncbi:hypothetical protein C8Q76DRAFT_448192 [Earliella scabrosa]|nr:hypothetical protein C8Q76DRAFT_448192 [Earliella scabrosa]